MNESFVTGTTRAGYASTAISYKDWMAGLEYSNGIADQVAGAPRLRRTD